MSSLAQITIHHSQFPEQVRRDLLESLRRREVNHKLHYESVKQTQKWLALHEAYSPARNDPDCLTIYECGFGAATDRIVTNQAHVIGLGCGGGQKDKRLLELLRERKFGVFYTPVDVGSAMVLVARQAALEVIPDSHCFPFVCDLAKADADDLGAVLEKGEIVDASRLITFFGMIPNFEPQIILPRLASLVRNSDWLLFSANLAPGPDYHAGIERVLPLYDNQLTRDWLITFLTDLGIENSDGVLEFSIEPVADGLERIVANFRFTRNREIHIENHHFEFPQGEKIRLFFSFRYTPSLVRSCLAKHGLEAMEEWVTRSEEEGVFLCRRLSRKI